MIKNQLKTQWIIVSLLIPVMIAICVLGNFFNTKIQTGNAMISTNNESIISNLTVYDQLTTSFDSYEITKNDTSNQISAVKDFVAEDLSATTNTSLANSDVIHSAYDVFYDYESDLVYLTITITNSKDEILNVQTMQAFPIITDNNDIDALFNIDGNFVYLSEILSGNVDECFFFALALSLFAAKLVAAVIVTAKVVVAITAVVAIGYMTYKVAEMTKAKVAERTKVSETQRNKPNPKVYYPAKRHDGKLLIAAVPVDLKTAAPAIKANSDFWSSTPNFAKQLALTASGGFIGPEVDKNKPGYYYHFHLLNRIGGHSFYGAPVGGIY